MPRARPPAVAGKFYAEHEVVLSAIVRKELEQAAQRALAAPEAETSPIPKALIVPHAGYVCSGSIAASGCCLLGPARGKITRVVLLGPSHFVRFPGLALPDADRFCTPLGEVPIDVESERLVAALPQVRVLEEAHAQEHCLEVELPFLQEVLDGFEIVALVTGEASPEQVAEVIETLWGGEETLIVISSDLSHYHPYDDARQRDARTARMIEQLRPNELDRDSACGRLSIQGLLLAAQRQGLSARTVDLRNSGDTVGSRQAVVGYGAFAFA